MNDAYLRLIERLKHRHLIGSVQGLLGWDEQVNLPPQSADFRAEQMATIAGLEHAAASDGRIGEALAQLEAAIDDLDSDQQIVVRRRVKTLTA